MFDNDKSIPHLISVYSLHSNLVDKRTKGMWQDGSVVAIETELTVIHYVINLHLYMVTSFMVIDSIYLYLWPSI